ncbi:hypothetical protein NCCP436_24810 [Pseudomonas sp. NCCP-436]|nr:hypothetical protein NCCP436_24810 [Pseudomonas sp. NCCP-436]
MYGELELENAKLRDWLEPPESCGSHWFQKRGRAFERILNAMLSKEEMEPRTSMRPSGEEVDGSFAIGEDFYLLEAKWHASPIPASSLYSFKGKVDGKLIGTIGVFFSMSDYSTDAVDALLNGKELNLILFGHNDLLLIEDGKITLREAMRVKRRYAASYGQPFYPLETYLSEVKSPSLGITDRVRSQPWSILVEGEDDVRTIQVLLERFDIDAQFNVVPAGGQLAIAQLAEHLISNNAKNVAAIITPIPDPEIQQEQVKKLNEIGAEIIVLKQDLEGWLDNYVSAEYHNATFILSDRNGKMARRYARNADLEKLLSENPSFSELMLKLGAKPKG